MHFPRPDEIKQKKKPKPKKGAFPRPQAEKLPNSRPTKKVSKGYWRRFARYHTLLGFISFFITLIFFFVVALKALISPGPVYCKSSQCSAQVSGSTNAVFIALGAILYIPMGIIHGLIIACPGAMMDHPRRHKMMAFTGLLLIVWSFMHLIGTEVYRSFVFELSTVSPYVLTLSRVVGEIDPSDPSRASIRVTATGLDEKFVGGEQFLLQVYRVDGDETFMLLSDIKPLNTPVWTDSKSIPATGSLTRHVPIEALNPGSWYVMAFVPAKGSEDKPKPVDRHMKFFDELQLPAGGTFHRCYVDRRPYKFCRFKDGGCTVSREP